MKGMIKIDKELCKGCGYCVDACPSGVIVIEEEFNTKGYFPASPRHPDKCTGCCMCAEICPEVAIEVYRDARKSHSRKARL
jgi:2-oxoglutarate ferredoxin oxidoreductase subunit delta